MAGMCTFFYVYITLFSFIFIKSYSFRVFTDSDIKMYREKVVQMFHHAYDHYLKSAFPYDELQPISCRGMDTWGSFSLTLIDALDTLAVMKNYTEFRRVVNTLLATADFNVNINVSVFETNIRVVGGLLSAHLLSKRAGLDVDPGWPCSGPLLNLAEKVARKLLPAFNTKTGMPYGTVNLLYGVPPGETPITCTAGVSTFIIEFGTLSQLTGDPVFENVAVNALNALWQRRSPLGLVGNHINVQDGKWTALDSGIGGGVDSYFEYLVKGAILFQEPKFMKMFKEYEKIISKYMKRDDWYFWVSMSSGQVTMPTFQSLEAFWPGLLTLVGDIPQAVKTLYNYHQVWKQYGFTPEIYDVSHSHAKRENYPLRPELIESIMYLYYATKDQHLLEIGVDILESIEHSARTDCGYATIKNVVDHKIEDRMESFFLAETTKYLYLLFDPDNFIHNNGSCGELIQMSGGNCIIGAGGYIFNTEAHPIDVGAVYCCSAKHQDHQILLYEFQKKLDLHSLLEIRDMDDFFKVFKQSKKQKYKSEKILKNVTSIEILNGTQTTGIDNNSEDMLSTEKNSFSVSFNNSVNNILHDRSQNSNSTFYNEEMTNENITNVNAEVTKDISDTNISSSDFIHSNSTLLSNTTFSEELDDLETHSDNELNSNSTFIVHESSESLENRQSDVLDQASSNFAVSDPNLTSTSVIHQKVDEKSISLSSSDDLYDKEFCSYEFLVCPAQPFISRLNIMGEMFNI
ncbi:ER degradation-enhancing alpha-mannosidase-like protein 2 [Stegodyphus dumicola]|uniref:ER degradation-enhancing alpha-mannosidase-like protein 2 n=1 Tax=Stegodyphus dumicola TaxID=202533 RepID=UPI0015B007F7|nr:ER degradation-enhancing alpha-mannosidase-like protein 2 [Stegodyphus dumicola]